MIIEGILKSVYGGNLSAKADDQEYVLPENLKHFYESMNNKN
jgi:hypothetical protein